jgi:hypothetical protein
MDALVQLVANRRRPPPVDPGLAGGSLAWALLEAGGFMREDAPPRQLAEAVRTSKAEVAAELLLSEATVETHVTRILSKLELRDRVQIVVLAYDSGLVQPGAA